MSISNDLFESVISRIREGLDVNVQEEKKIFRSVDIMEHSKLLSDMYSEDAFETIKISKKVDFKRFQDEAPCPIKEKEVKICYIPKRAMELLEVIENDDNFDDLEEFYDFVYIVDYLRIFSLFDDIKKQFFHFDIKTIQLSQLPDGIIKMIMPEYLKILSGEYTDDLRIVDTDMYGIDSHVYKSHDEIFQILRSIEPYKKDKLISYLIDNIYINPFVETDDHEYNGISCTSNKIIFGLFNILPISKELLRTRYYYSDREIEWIEHLSKEKYSLHPHGMHSTTTSEYDDHNRCLSIFYRDGIDKIYESDRDMIYWRLMDVREDPYIKKMNDLFISREINNLKTFISSIKSDGSHFMFHREPRIFTINGMYMKSDDYVWSYDDLKKILKNSHNMLHIFRYIKYRQLHMMEEE